MKLTWYGQSGFRVETGKSVIMIDPFLSGSPVYDGTVEEAANGTTHVILTHGHDDHIGDTVEICQKNDAVLLANFEICTHLGGLGVEKCDPGNLGGTLNHDDFSCTFVRADHSSSSSADGTNIYLGNPAGLVIKADGKTLYHMGDTAIFSDMALINELYLPDVGLVPVGDRFTMDGKTAALACRRYFDFKTVIPIHYKTFDLLAPNPDDFVEAMGDNSVTVLDIGESYSF